MLNEGNTLKDSAAKAGIDPKTARKYLINGSYLQKADHNWKTRKDPFEGVWQELEDMLSQQPGLEAKTLFAYLLDKYPGQFKEGQLRSLQRKVKKWKGMKGEAKEVYFAQIHHPGDLCSSDFSHMDELKVTIQGHVFSHLIYHFVLTYSNWESVTICYSENLESLSEGLQNALWQLGGSPVRHRTDRLTAAMSNFANRPKFGARYQALLDHYGIVAEKTQVSSPHENGDVEQSHHRFKQALDQALMLRNSRDFDSIDEYKFFLMELIIKRNGLRKESLKKELERLRKLPSNRLQDASIQWMRVGKGSTIRVKEVTYSVPSRLIGEEIEVRLLGSTLEIWYQRNKVEEYPRISGGNKARIDYRHIIDWLIRKPNAFENYRYKEELYPTSTFRAAYDALKETNVQRCVKEYLGILKAASQNGEERVSRLLKKMLIKGDVSLKSLLEELSEAEKVVSLTSVEVFSVDLNIYDAALLEEGNK